MTQIASLFGACQQKREGILASFPTAKIMIFCSDSKFGLNLVYKSFSLLEGVERKKLWWRKSKFWGRKSIDCHSEMAELQFDIKECLAVIR